MINQRLIREQLYKYRYYISIAAAVALITRRVYHNLFIPPKNLRHIPTVSYLRQFLSMLSKETVGKRTDRLILPVLAKSKDGIYLVSTIYIVPLFPLFICWTD